MEDIAPALYDKIKADFDSRVSGDAEIQLILKRIEEGTATARDTQYYAIRIGKHAADAFKENISSEVLPDGKMYYNIAERTVVPQLMENYEMVEGVAEAVQQQLNAEAGIGLNPVHVDVNQSRIDGIINRITAADVYDTVAWMLVEPVRNFTQSVADDFVRENVAFQSKAGLSPKITREVYGNCCAWCAALAGTYEYKKEPKDFYRKHEYCRCLIIYDPGNGKVQNSHTKEWFQNERDARVKASEEYNQTHQTIQSDEARTTISKYASIDIKDTYELAKEGYRHGGVYVDAVNATKPQLRKSIIHHTEQVIRHYEKINNPTAFISDWDSKDERYKRGLLHKWEKDLKRNAEQAQIEIAVWEEKFE